MAPTALDSYLLGNKAAVKTGIKISISVLGALFIALLMSFEHPVWAMITGMISFLRLTTHKYSKSVCFNVSAPCWAVSSAWR